MYYAYIYLYICKQLPSIGVIQPLPPITRTSIIHWCSSYIYIYLFFFPTTPWMFMANVGSIHCVFGYQIHRHSGHNWWLQWWFVCIPWKTMKLQANLTKKQIRVPKHSSWMVGLFLGGGFIHFLCSPLFGEDFQFWLIFFRWVETTNQIFIPTSIPQKMKKNSCIGKDTIAPLSVWVCDA